ncbi:MAG: hypothetical protein MJY98_00285 [Fibrobacter sp.]|nr:hypothetical protein [Fibrobacter sp.]
MGSKKRFAINGFAQVFAFLVSIGITFFLTPYIVSRLGAAAYGFVGLASNFVSYAQIITIALNSMAGRFITISVHQNRIEDARRYFSSVFFSNLILVGIISLIGVAVLFRLEYIIQIPSELMSDVKMLFGCIFLNFFISIIFNVYNVSTFIRNRLDLSSTRTIIGNSIKALFLVGAFYFFDPAVWFIGLATVISTIYIVITNIHFRRKLTPELIIAPRYFDVKSIKELLCAGVWNIISRLNTLLHHGFDLLIANLFIGPVEMGVLAIVKRIPALTLTLFEQINAIFAPPWTKLYAEEKTGELHSSILKALRFFGIISYIPTAFIFVYCDWFYQMWLPSQDARLLYLLTVAGCIDLPIAMPLQPIYNIYPITNKIRANSLFGVGIYGLTFVTVVTGIYLTEDPFAHMVIIAGTGSFYNAIKSITFLPIYGAHCIKMKVKYLYTCTLRSIISFTILLVPLFAIKNTLITASWLHLGIGGASTCIFGILIGYLFVMTKDDRKAIPETIQKISNRFKKK